MHLESKPDHLGERRNAPSLERRPWIEHRGLTLFAIGTSIDESNGDFTLGTFDRCFLLADWIVAGNTVDGVGIELSVIESSRIDFHVLLIQRLSTFGTTGGVL